MGLQSMCSSYATPHLWLIFRISTKRLLTGPIIFDLEALVR
jgi:hypothetical protein